MRWPYGLATQAQCLLSTISRLTREKRRFPKNLIGVYHDIVLVKKTLTSRYMNTSAAVATAKIDLSIFNPELPAGGCLMLWPTLMRNSLACATANASFSYPLTWYWIDQAQKVMDYTEKSHLIKWTVIPEIEAVAVLEFKVSVNYSWFYHQFVLRGVYNLSEIYAIFMPPYVISRE